MERFASSLRKQSTHNTIAAIRNRRDFDAANLHGEAYPFGRPYLDQYNRLPEVWQREFRADAGALFGNDTGRILYVIRSWVTPIAWFVEGEGWVYPPVKYSPYTTRQQELVEAAITGERTIPRREHLAISIDWEWEVAA